MRRRPALAVLVLLASLPGVAVGGSAGVQAVGPGPAGAVGVTADSGAPAVAGVADDRSATVTFGELDPDDDGTLVTVEAVGLSDGGFVTVREESATGTLVGVSKHLPAGTHTDVLLRVQEPIRPERTYVAVVHRDTDGDETFDWEVSDGEDDVPYTNDEGEPVADDTAWMPNQTDGSTSSSTATPTPYCTGCGDTPSLTPTPTFEECPNCPEDCTGMTYLPECTATPSPTPHGWTTLLGPLLAFLAFATAGLLAVGAVLARWRLAPDEEP